MAAQVPKIPTCNTHPEEEVALFCTSCEEGVCMTCMIENNHGQHKLCKPTQILEVKKKEFKELMENEGEDELCKRISEQIELINRHKATVTDHQSKTSTAIANRSEELGQLIEKEKESLLIHSKRLHDQELNLLSDQKSVSLRCLSLLEEHRSDPESFLHTHQEEMQQVMRDLKLIQAYTQPVDINSVVNFDIGQRVTEADVKNMFGTIKEQHKELEDADKHMKLVNIYKPNFSNSNLGFSAITKISPIDMQTAFVLLGDCELYQVQLDVHQMLPAKLIASGVLDITQVSNNCIYLCTGTQVKRCNLKGDIYVLDDVGGGTVRSVALTYGDNVLVCSRCETTDFEGQKVIRCVLHELDSSGIAIQAAFQATIRDASQIYRIEQHCGQTCFLGKSQEGGAIQQGNNNCICYTCKYMYTGNLGTRPEVKFDPRGMCCDNKEQIIIADYGNSALHLLNENWEFEKFLLREWDGLKGPTAITLYNRFLWIGQEDGSIQVRNYECQKNGSLDNF